MHHHDRLLTGSSELAINSYIARYYLKNFPYLGQTRSGQWASMFGLLNVFTRYDLLVKLISVCVTDLTPSQTTRRYHQRSPLQERLDEPLAQESMDSVCRHHLRRLSHRHWSHGSSQRIDDVRPDCGHGFLPRGW